MAFTEPAYHISLSIKEYLAENGLRAYKLADAAGCNRTALGHWLHRESMPSTRALVRLADHMNVSLDHMLGRAADRTFIQSGSPVPFPKRLKKLAEDVGLSLYRVAAECGVGTSAVSKWLAANGRLPEVDTLIQLAEMFGCSVDYLVGRTNIR